MKIAALLNTEISGVIGWSIIHSLWQFLALFALLKIALLIINKSNSDLRYFVSLVFLAASVICVAATVNYEYGLTLPEHAQSVTATVPVIKTQAAVNQPAEVVASQVTATPGRVFLNYLNTASPYLTFCWVIGMMVYTARITVGGIYLNRMRRLSSGDHPEIVNVINELSSKMGLGKNVRLIINNKITEPVTFGWLKPVLLLPFSYLGSIPAEQLEMILAHELAHIKRHDYMVNLLQTALEAVFFFNPFFKAMSGMVRDEREYCCDDMAIATCGNHTTMAIALTNLRVLSNYPRLSLSAAPVQQSFTERVYRLVNPSAKSRLSVKSALASFMMVIFALILLINVARYQQSNPNLPSANDPMSQLYTDNQANCKEQLFNYVKAGNSTHELFLISTINGKPLYAYVDGSLVTKSELDQIHQVLNKKRSMTRAEIAAMTKKSTQEATDQSWKLGMESDTLAKAIDAAKAEFAAHPSASLDQKLKDLHRRLNENIRQQVKLSMSSYNKEVKKIPAEVKLHILLNKIILGKEYTPAERQQLNELARTIQSV